MRSTSAIDTALVTLAGLLLYLFTVCPTVPFGDGPELIAA
jgi:hypothetical protein